MPSFDIVSEIDTHEVANAVDQTNREIGTRYDFKGTDSGVEQSGDSLIVRSESEFQIRQIQDILYQRMTKRGIDIAALAAGRMQASGKKTTLDITVRQGIDQDTARKIVKLLKESKLRVQGSIQGNKVRVTGKKRDDLQAAIATIRDADLGLPLQYNNFRD
jgi:uncharacterized protein YajQ (UPF0234 family)